MFPHLKIIQYWRNLSAPSNFVLSNIPITATIFPGGSIKKEIPLISFFKLVIFRQERRIRCLRHHVICNRQLAYSASMFFLLVAHLMKNFSFILGVKLNRYIFFTAGLPYRRKVSSDSWMYILFPLFIGWTLISGFLLVCCVLCYALLLVFRRHRYYCFQ